MAKVFVGSDIGSYTFDAANKRVSLLGLPSLVLEQIEAILELS